MELLKLRGRPSDISEYLENAGFKPSGLEAWAKNGTTIIGCTIDRDVKFYLLRIRGQESDEKILRESLEKKYSDILYST